MSTFHPPSYQEALEATRSRPQKPRSTLKPRRKKLPRGRKGKPKKRPTISQLKKKAWKQFSIFIRTRGADGNGFNSCFTCDVIKFWRELQAGHFIAGRLNNNLFAEKGCHPQCSTCNILKAGNTVVYYRKMVEQYGEDSITELLLNNNRTRKWQPGELEALLENYSLINSQNPLTAK